MEFDKETAFSSIQDRALPADLRRAALSWLLSHKQCKGEHDALDRALQAWTATALNSSAPLERLMAVAEIVRIGQANRALISASDNALTQALTDTLPVFPHEVDADIRANVSVALRRKLPPWALGYATHALSMEDKSDRVRTELVEVLVALQPTLESALNGLASEFERLAEEDSSSPKTLTRRAVSILNVLRPAFAVSDLEPGNSPGLECDRLARMAVRPFGNKIDKKSATELSAQLIRFVQTMVRTRFSLSLEPGTYASVRRASGFFERGAWPKSLARELRGLERDIVEALVLLGKQGVESRDLLTQLAVVMGRDAAKRQTAFIVEGHPELPENVQFFLQHWETRSSVGKDSDDIQEAVFSLTDRAIADALVEARRIQTGPPDAGESGADVAGIAAGLARRVDDIAKRRRISFLGKVGGLEKASLKYFDSESGSLEGAVKRSAVVQTKLDGSPGICLIKGLLE